MAKEILRSTLRVAIAISLCMIGSTIAQGQMQTPRPRRVYAGGYPWLAHLAAAEGKVELVARISSNGSVQAVRVVSGNGLLSEPAKFMLSRWIFDPCEENRCDVTITFHFVLESGVCDAADCPAEVELDLPADITIRSKHTPPTIGSAQEPERRGSRGVKGAVETEAVFPQRRRPHQTDVETARKANDAAEELLTRVNTSWDQPINAVNDLISGGQYFGAGLTTTSTIYPLYQGPGYEVALKTYQYGPSANEWEPGHTN